MLTCRQASALVSSGMDQRLSPAQRIGLMFHLAMCKYCRRFRKQLQIIQKAAMRYDEVLQAASPAGGLSNEAIDRITKTIHEHSH
ncbi:MAG: zf-HC2 domain-containing protein [Deltaproteobacteria bacterium]|nr:zf-HC2 domain-containing protein [Deltaproteobacteria bacterium]